MGRPQVIGFLLTLIDPFKDPFKGTLGAFTYFPKNKKPQKQKVKLSDFY